MGSIPAGGTTKIKMEKYIYKIQHIPTGLFVRIKLSIHGILGWKKRIDEGKLLFEGKDPAMGQVLHKTHEGWSTPPEPSNEDFKLIDCRIVKYKVLLMEVHL